MNPFCLKDERQTSNVYDVNIWYILRSWYRHHYHLCTTIEFQSICVCLPRGADVFICVTLFRKIVCSQNDDIDDLIQEKITKNKSMMRRHFRCVLFSLILKSTILNVLLNYYKIHGFCRRYKLANFASWVNRFRNITKYIQFGVYSKTIE